MDGTILLENWPVVPNLLNLKSKNDLDNAIRYISLIRMDELKFAKLPKLFDLRFFNEIHKYIYSDVFGWAGEENENKIKETNYIIERFNQIEWIKMYLQDKAESITDFIFDLTKLQPYQVGSFQTVMTYVGMYAKAHRLPLDLEYIDFNALAIEKDIAAEMDIGREGVQAIVKEAMLISLARENTSEKISETIIKSGYKPTDLLINQFKKLNLSLVKFHTVMDLYDLYKHPEMLGKIETKMVCEIASGFAYQDTTYSLPSYKYKEKDYLEL